MDLLSSVKAQSYFAEAYRKVNVNPEALITYATALRMNQKPSEYTTKGGTIAEPEDSGQYKIQLGAFKEMKNIPYLAKSYGFGEVDEQSVDDLLSYDFTNINGKVYRRYYYGHYDSKSEALMALKYLEKKSKQKLMLVKN